MSKKDLDVFQPAIERVLDDIVQVERALAEKKRMANTLCSYAGTPPMFPDEETGPVIPSSDEGDRASGSMGKEMELEPPGIADVA